ncbi:hypothetical protein [Nocardia sp. NPDC004750]
MAIERRTAGGRSANRTKTVPTRRKALVHHRAGRAEQSDADEHWQGRPPCAELNVFVVPSEDDCADSASKIAGSGFRDLSFRRAHAAMTAAHDPFANCRITGNFGRMVIPACPS